MRLKEKRKSEPSRSDVSSTPPTKRFRPDLHAASSDAKLPEAEYQVKLDDLKEEWDGRRREPVMKLLMASTRANRRQWLQSTPELNLRKLMELFPTFIDGSYVSIHCKSTPLDSFLDSLCSPNGMHFPAIRAVQGDCQWPVELRTFSLVIWSQKHCNWGISQFFLSVT